MSWSKQTKGGSSGGWGGSAWGTSSWGSPFSSTWTKQGNVSDTWIVHGLLYDGASVYDSDTQYNSGLEIEVWTKVADAT